MGDVTILDSSDPEELADILDSYSVDCARKTGDYRKSSNLSAASAWLRELSERDTKGPSIANHPDDVSALIEAVRDYISDSDLVLTREVSENITSRGVLLEVLQQITGVSTNDCECDPPLVFSDCPIHSTTSGEDET